MEEIQGYVDILVEVIKDSSTYRRYTACENKLKEQPGLRKRIDEFRLAAYQFNNYEKGGTDLFDKLDQFEKEYGEFRRNPAINEFLEAELDVCRMLQKIYSRIEEGASIQIPRS